MSFILWLLLFIRYNLTINLLIFIFKFFLQYTFSVGISSKISKCIFSEIKLTTQSFTFKKIDIKTKYSLIFLIPSLGSQWCHWTYENQIKCFSSISNYFSQNSLPCMFLLNFHHKRHLHELWRVKEKQ